MESVDKDFQVTTINTLKDSKEHHMNKGNLKTNQMEKWIKRNTK